MSDELIQQLKMLLEADKDIELALVFGSILTKRFGSESDIDVGVAYSQPLGIDKRVRLAQEL